MRDIQDVATTPSKERVLFEQIMKWGRDKGINNPEKQLDKLHEEAREATTALAVADYASQTQCAIEEMESLDSHLIEEVGDIGVVWLLLCQMLNIDPLDALRTAHNKNKDRQGKTINGDFIKEEDL